MLRNVPWALVSLTVLFQASSSQYHHDYVHDRQPGQGKLWLSWSPERRRGFSHGYLWAYDIGFKQACMAYFNTNPSPPGKLRSVEESPLQKCLLLQLRYSNPGMADYYESKITAFYEKYPTDTDLPITWLFQAFSDQDNKSPEGIHRAWTNHEHP